MFVYLPALRCITYALQYVCVTCTKKCTVAMGMNILKSSKSCFYCVFPNREQFKRSESNNFALFSSETSNLGGLKAVKMVISRGIKNTKTKCCRSSVYEFLKPTVSFARFSTRQSSTEQKNIQGYVHRTKNKSACETKTGYFEGK